MAETPAKHRSHEHNVRMLIDSWEQEHPFLGKLRSLLEQRFNERREKFGNLNLEDICDNCTTVTLQLRAADNFAKGDLIDGCNLLILSKYVHVKHGQSTE